MLYPLERGELLPRVNVYTALVHVVRGVAVTRKGEITLGLIVTGQLSDCSMTQFELETVLMAKPVVGGELGFVTPPKPTTNVSLPGRFPVKKEEIVSWLSVIVHVGVFFKAGLLLNNKVSVPHKVVLLAAVIVDEYSGGKTIWIQSVVMILAAEIAEVVKVKVYVTDVCLCKSLERPIEFILNVCLLASCKEQQVVESIMQSPARRVRMRKLDKFLHQCGRVIPVMVRLTGISLSVTLTLNLIVLLAPKQVIVGVMTLPATKIVQLESFWRRVSSEGMVRYITSVLSAHCANWKFSWIWIRSFERQVNKAEGFRKISFWKEDPGMEYPVVC